MAVSDDNEFEFDDKMFNNKYYADDFDFNEEFDKSDVINSDDDDDDDRDPFEVDLNEEPEFGLKKPKKSHGEPILSIEDLEIEQILNFDDEAYSRKSFEGKVSQAAASTEILPDQSHKHFRDFIVAPKITGYNRSIPHSKRLPAEYIKSRSQIIEIADDPSLRNIGKSQATVIVNRDENGEIESIEVISKSGERTFIKFELAESNEEFQLTEVYNTTIQDPVDFHQKVEEQKSHHIAAEDDILLSAQNSKKVRPSEKAALKNPIFQGIDDEIVNLMINMRFYW